MSIPKKPRHSSPLAKRPDGAHGEEHPAAVGQGDEPIARIESGSAIVQRVDHDRHGADTFIGQPQAPQQGVHQQELSQPLSSARQVPGQASKEDDRSTVGLGQRLPQGCGHFGAGNAVGGQRVEPQHLRRALRQDKAGRQFPPDVLPGLCRDVGRQRF